MSNQVNKLLDGVWNLLNDCVEANGDVIWMSNNESIHEAFLDIVSEYAPERLDEFLQKLQDGL